MMPGLALGTVHSMLERHTVAFLAADGRGRRLYGSGVLVDRSDARAILTAQAVLERLPHHGRLGLAVNTALNQISIPCDSLRYSLISQADGPQLGKVTLADSVVRRLAYANEFTRSFGSRSSASNTPGGYYANGFVNEITVTRYPLDCFDNVTNFTNVSASLRAPLNATRQSTLDQIEPAVGTLDGLVGGGVWAIMGRDRYASLLGVIVEVEPSEKVRWATLPDHMNP